MLAAYLKNYKSDFLGSELFYEEYVDLRHVDSILIHYDPLHCFGKQ